jgi:formylglycine-generating enzyme
MSLGARATAVLATAHVMAACGGTTQPAALGPGADAGTDGGQMGADAALGDGPDAAPYGCPSLPGPQLLAARTPNGHGYCIGATEVTNAQYAVFLAANPGGPSGQPAVCAWLHTWKPYVLCDQTYDPVNKPDFPVACVSWCAAQAYCNWAGQRLCGRVGAGPLSGTDLGDAAKDEWFNACSAGGVHAYPYGDNYSASTCNGKDYGGTGTLAYESLASCTGGIAGLMNMSGNVAEWVDACTGTAGESDFCAARGGSFGATADELRCAGGTSPSVGRDVSTPAFGIRCCY